VTDKTLHGWKQNWLAALAPGTLELDSFSWNRKLARYVKAGQYEKTIQLFREMQQKRMSLDRFTFVPVLNACASLQALDEGLRTAMISGHVNVEKGTKQWNYFDKCKRKKVCN
jgi:pentatricopeptide repeat protein